MGVGDRLFRKWQKCVLVALELYNMRSITTQTYCNIDFRTNLLPMLKHDKENVIFPYTQWQYRSITKENPWVMHLH